MALYRALDELRANVRGLPGHLYISRIPWIIPGYALNAFFDARTASLVLHTTLAVGGGLLFYLLCRRYVGAVAAAIGYTALLGNQMYFNAHRWDYPEGGVIAFLIAAYTFALPQTTSLPVRAVSLAASGFVSAALVTMRTVRRRIPGWPAGSPFRGVRGRRVPRVVASVDP